MSDETFSKNLSRRFQSYFILTMFSDKVAGEKSDGFAGVKPNKLNIFKGMARMLFEGVNGFGSDCVLAGGPGARGKI